MDMQAHASCAQVRPVKCFAGAHAGLVAIVSVAKADCIACHSIDIASFVDVYASKADGGQRTGRRHFSPLTSDSFQLGFHDRACQSARLDGIWTAGSWRVCTCAAVAWEWWRREMQVADSHPRKDRQSGLIFADSGCSAVCGDSRQMSNLASCASKARRARLETIAPIRELDR